MPYTPIPADFGGALRIYHLLKSMALRHEVTLLSYGEPEDRDRLTQHFPLEMKNIYIVPKPWGRRYKRAAQMYSMFGKHSFFYMMANNKEMQYAIDAVVEKKTFDIIQTEFSHLGLFRFDTDAIRILDAHNVEYDNFRRMASTDSLVRKVHYHMEYRKVFEEEVEGCRRQDALLVTSERDKKIFDENVPTVPKFIVPNGVDSAYFSPGCEREEPFTMVFTGMMGYVPNYDGMLYFLDEIFPFVLQKIPTAKIYIVGKNPPQRLARRASSNVIITDYVDDVRPFIRRASVYVVPLRMGSGTRLKIAEALAMRKPIVTTSIGCEGIDVTHGETALIADDPKCFADSVVELFADMKLRQRLSECGYELMQTKYEWSIIGEQLDKVYRKLTETKKTQLNLVSA